MKCAIIRRKEVTLYRKSIKLFAGNVQFLPRLYKISGSATLVPDIHSIIPDQTIMIIGLVK